MAALAFLDVIDNGEQDGSDAHQARSSEPSESGSSRADSDSPVQNARAATPLRNLATIHCPSCERNMGDSSLTQLPIAGYEDVVEDELKIVAGRIGYCKRCYSCWRTDKSSRASLGVTTQLFNDGDERWGWDLDFAIYTILTRTQRPQSTPPIAGFEEKGEGELKLVTVRGVYSKRCYNFWRTCRPSRSSMRVMATLLNDDAAGAFEEADDDDADGAEDDDDSANSDDDSAKEDDDDSAVSLDVAMRSVSDLD